MSKKRHNAESPAPEDLLAAQHLVLEMIALGSPLEEVLRELASFVDRQATEGMSCICLLDPDGRTLRPVSGSKISPDILSAISPMRAGPRCGACGTEVYRRERVIVADVASDPLFEGFRELPLRLGLRACWSTPILSSDGLPLGIIGVAYTQPHTPTKREIDVVERASFLAKIAIERRRTDEALVTSHDRYQELFENANDIVYTHDLAGTITSLNHAGELLMGRRREEVVGVKMRDFVAPEHRALLREMTERKIGGETKTTYELEIVSKDGSHCLLEVSTRLIFQSGKPVAVQGIGRDVTERRRLESHLRQSQKMEAIGRLAGGISHDFNNLLTVITGYSQWLLDEIPHNSPLAENAAEILMASNRAAALTNQLLAFSRNQVIHPIVLDLNSLVTRVDQMLRRLIGEDIELIVSTSPDLALVRADPVQIEQVILNLGINARDAMPDGGKLTIATSTAQIDEKSARDVPGCIPGDYILLAVSDTGCGIEEKIKPYIFEPFFTTKEVGKGTGLGLSTVYGIVKKCGGHIRVDSEPGAGALFWLYLPKAAETVLPVLAAKPQAAGGGTETILLVEDEASVRRIVGAMLVRLGYTVLEVPDARSALNIATSHRQKPIHLVLTDVVMPQLSGPELARQLKALRGDLKVLLMSGYAGEPMLETGREPGAAYLQKPFTPDALAGKIREVLDGD